MATSIGVVRDSKGKVIAKENRQEYLHEKRMKELANKGYNSGNIRYMMGHERFKEKQIKKAIKNKSINVDGNL